MASLNSVYIKLDTLKQITHTLEVKGEKGVELTIAVNDEVNNYNQNVSAFVAQTKEQRETKTKTTSGQATGYTTRHKASRHPVYGCNYASTV